MRQSKNDAGAGGRFSADRKGKRPFSDAQVLARWRRIRDGALVRLEEHVVDGKPKGLLSYSDTVIKAQQAIEQIEATQAVKKLSSTSAADRALKIRANGIRLEDIDFGHGPAPEA